jgi:hypothetical protein
VQQKSGGRKSEGVDVDRHNNYKKGAQSGKWEKMRD